VTPIDRFDMLDGLQSEPMNVPVRPSVVTSVRLLYDKGCPGDVGDFVRCR
jgi:hypothetical protein